MVRQVLNYHDVQLYDTDVALFASSQWLNDNAINFYLQFLYHTLCLGEEIAGMTTTTTTTSSRGSAPEGQGVLLMDPAVVSCMMLQCDDDEDLADLARGLDLRHKRLCLLPVNDNQSFDGESTHWSLLVYRDGRFVHYDSSAGHNTTAAQRVARVFLRLLGAAGLEDLPAWTPSVLTNAPDAPQQTNGYDCGMYVLLVAEYLCRAFVGGREPEGSSLGTYVTPEAVTRRRLEIPLLISRLRG